MKRLRDWWERLTGTATATREPRPPKSPHAQSEPDPPAGGLKLADGTPQRKPSRLGEAGFDPYSSDAGYAKPHSWERIDHD